MINIIAAISKNRAIGRGGEMPWHISEDLKFFKRTTMGATVVMGRRTWESLGCKPLPGRCNIVVSRTMEPCDGITVIPSLDEIFNNTLKYTSDKEIFIIGGGQIYEQAIGHVQRMYLTHIDAEVADADTFFPEINADEWLIEQQSEIIKDIKSGLQIRFITYLKK